MFNIDELLQTMIFTYKNEVNTSTENGYRACETRIVGFNS